jgi:hypothetical protein
MTLEWVEPLMEDVDIKAARCTGLESLDTDNQMARGYLQV